jgi:hypothetical protein
VSKVRTAFIALMMKAVRISETSVEIIDTLWSFFPEGYQLHTRRLENVKCHIG